MQKKKPSDIEIARRLADYPPEFLYHLALISRDELDRIKARERHVANWYGYRRAVFQ